MAELTPNALKILEERYYHSTDTQANDVWARVARAVAEAESGDSQVQAGWRHKFYKMMLNLDFLPNSPTIKNAGVDNGTLSACFVLPVEDTLEGILQTHQDAALIEASGGGIGYSFTNIRAKGSSISRPQAKACGPVAVMDHLGSLGKMVTQGFREGAHMGQLDISHPDIREFIHYKDNQDRVSNFNISVQVPDAWMKLIGQQEPAMEELWNEICESAWKTGDPGIVFIDRVHESQPTMHYGQIQSSNPCGEEFLEPYGNCCLGSINLANFVLKNGRAFDWNRLKETIYTAVRFLDDVIEVNWFPVKRLREVNLNTRRIGLGVMGWADALVELEIPYDSALALSLARKTSEFLTTTAWDASMELARERGPFPLWEGSELQKSGELEPVRNASVTTIAPTGTISLIAGCSQGIEPHFSHEWTRKALWSKGQSTDLKEEAPEHARTAHEIHPLDHIAMQAVWQEYVTNSISKTINMPNSATVEDVKEAFHLAWEQGCKAITIYREGSRDVEVLTPTKRLQTKRPNLNNRPKVVQGSTTRIPTSHGSLFVTVNSVAGEPFEVFATLGKSGSTNSAHIEAITRLISVGLQQGLSVERIVGQLRGISDQPIWTEGVLIESIPDAIAFVLSGGEVNGDVVHFEHGEDAQTCPNCHKATLHQTEGCVLCSSCGYSKC